MRERELHLYSESDPSKSTKVWSFGTASGPLIPVVDSMKRVVYLQDRSGATLRWIETFAPYNEGVCSTSVDQSSNACLVHPLGLKLMEGEVNRLMIADTKGNCIPVKIAIGRKSYVEFHEDIYTDIEIEPSVSVESWLTGKDELAKVAKITPELVSSAMSGAPLTRFISDTRSNGDSLPTTTTTMKPSKETNSINKSKPVDSPALSTREQRKWDKEESAAKASELKNVNKENDRTHGETSTKSSIENDIVPAVSETGKPSQSVEQTELGPVDSIGKGMPETLEDEEALEALRARRVTPVLEALHDNIQKPSRDVAKEDLSARRAEYGAPGSSDKIAVSSIEQPRTDTAPNSTSNVREVFREDLSARRAEYGAPSRINTSVTKAPSTSSPSLSAREQRKWDKESSTAASSSPREVYKEDLGARRAEYGAKGVSSPVKTRDRSPSPAKPRERSPSHTKPVRVSTAEREVYKEDLASRRAEYGATPTLDGPSTASKEMRQALHKADVRDMSSSKVIEQPSPVQQAAIVDTSIPKAVGQPSPVRQTASPTKEELENAYAIPSSAQKKEVVKPLTSNKVDRTEFREIDDKPREYTRKYLSGKMHHPRNSYTSLTSLNASLPNTARMVDATEKYIVIPLAGPGGRVGILEHGNSGRMPPSIPAFAGGATVADFELDRFTAGRCVSAHIDQTVRVWQIPSSLEDLEADISQATHVFSGFDKIIGLSHHPTVKSLLMVTTISKVHLLDTDNLEDIKVFPNKGIMNSCWSLDGSSIALAMSDKSIKIISSRDGSEANNFSSAHSSTRPFRVAFVGTDKLVTAGFGKGSTRQVALYDTESGKILEVLDQDISPSPYSLPYFEQMTNVLYLVPRGTSNILPFYVTETLTALQAYSAADSVMGAAFLPPQLLEIKEVEVARCLRLTTNEITVVGFYIPRPSGDVFHDDIFPEAVPDAYTASCNISDWQSGQQDTRRRMVSMNKENLKPSSSNTSERRTPKKGVIKQDTEEKGKGSELAEMFSKAKMEDGDEPEFQNKASNTRWE